jgi:diacylglycerol kinase family enzyme
VGLRYDAWPTVRPGHATELARRAVAEGRGLVVAAGGDGTVNEVAQGLVGTAAVLGVLPLGSVMNVARTLHLPRDLEAAARVVADGSTLAMDIGRATGATATTYFLEAAGVGLDAALFRYFNRLERGADRLGVLRAAWAFVRGLGIPRLLLEVDGRAREVRAPMGTVANSPFLGAASAVPPEARVDDGQLDVVLFHGLSAPRVLLYLLLVAGGRPFPRPAGTESLRARTVAVAARRALPAHADGELLGRTPVAFSVVPGALRVRVGEPEPDARPAWGHPGAAPRRGAAGSASVPGSGPGGAMAPPGRDDGTSCLPGAGPSYSPHEPHERGARGGGGGVGRAPDRAPAGAGRPHRRARTATRGVRPR